MPSAVEIAQPRRAVDTVDRLGKYDLIAVIARGGMGDVYLAVAQGPVGFNKLLVVKELRHDALEDERLIAMFLDEARLAARLNHPNIVQTFEVGTDGRRRFLSMEYLEGQSLNRLLHRARKRGAPLPAAIHFHIVGEVLTALEYAHSLTEFDGTPLGIVHRDVSPHNVLVTYEGNVKLIDFGIAKTSLPLEQTNSGVLKGKLKYMAPEQALGRGVDRRADVFAAGMMLWEAIAGSGPWENVPDLTILRSLLDLEVPRLSDVRSELDPDLTAIVDRAIHPDPAFRYPTALALRDDLEHYVAVHGLSLGRELPAYVARLFGDERRKLRALIDAQLRILRTQGPIDIFGTRGRGTTALPIETAIGVVQNDNPGPDSEPASSRPPSEAVSPVMISQWKLRETTAPSARPAARRWAVASPPNLRGAASGLAIGAMLACAALLGRGHRPQRSIVAATQSAPQIAAAAPPDPARTAATAPPPDPARTAATAPRLDTTAAPDAPDAVGADRSAEPETAKKPSADAHRAEAVPSGSALAGPSAAAASASPLHPPPRPVPPDSSRAAASRETRKVPDAPQHIAPAREVDRENPYLP